MKGIMRGSGRAMVAMVVGLAGCTTILGIPDPNELEPNSGTGGAATSASTGAAGGAGGVGGSGNTGGIAGMGGSGGGVGCSTAADCPPPANECVTATCLNNTCGTMNVPQGMATMTQVDGDCMINQCTGTGEVEAVEDTSDAVDDMKECTTDTCKSDSTSMHTPVNAGTACSENGGKLCNNAGACVECITTSDCTVAGEICQSGNCNVPLCANAMKDGAETDSDCGGPDCNKCGTNKSCMAPLDCSSGVCTAMKCQGATCTDMVKNGTETDVDCGGMGCPGCAEAQVCVMNSDCMSGSCIGGFCGPGGAGGAGGVGGGGGAGGIGGVGGSGGMNVNACMNSVKDAGEGDVDCGGSCPNACSLGKTCNTNTDCSSLSCSNGVCATINGCNASTANDLTNLPTTTVTFSGLTYNPPCIKVKTGTSVTFSGSFPNHPLVGGEVKNGMEIPAASGPFVPMTNMGFAKTFTMSAAGTYPYYCDFHSSAGMYGTVFVVP